MDNITSETKDISRRSVLTGSATVAAATVIGAISSRSAPAMDHSKSHGGIHKARPTSLVNSARHCVQSGDECLSHCFDTFKAGDPTLAKCAVKIDNTIAVCNALAELGNNQSPYLKDMAAVCAKVCADCEKECRIHASQHEICATMAKACADTVAQCKEFIG